MSLVEKLSERPVATDPEGAGADFSFAYELFRQAAMEAAYGASRPGAEDFLHTLFEKEFADPQMRILTLDGAPVGFFCIAVCEDEVQLRHLYLDPAFRGQGIGHAIMDRALETAHEEKLPLTVSVPDGSPAVDFLMEAGFNIYGNRERYFGTGPQDFARSLDLRSRETEKYMPYMCVPEPLPQRAALRPRPF